MRPLPIRRARFAGLGVTLAAGGLLVAPAPAQAGVLDSPSTVAVADFDDSPEPGVTCNTTGAGTSIVPGTFAADGVPVTSSTSSSATITDAAVAADFTNLTASATNTVRATQANGALSSVDVSAALQAGVSSNLGTAQQCNARAEAGAGDGFEFDLPTPRYLTIEIDSSRVFGQFTLLNDTDNLDSAVYEQHFAYSPRFHDEQRVYMPAGHYLMVYEASTFVDAPTTTNGGAMSRTGSVTFAMDFHEPGAASTAAEGSGKRYLGLAGGRTCATDSLAAKWKNRAGKRDNRKVKKATFFVNDVKVKTVRKPKKKQTTTLKGLDPTRVANVEVRLKLVKRGAGTLTLERSYLPCT